MQPQVATRSETGRKEKTGTLRRSEEEGQQRESERRVRFRESVPSHGLDTPEGETDEGSIRSGCAAPPEPLGHPTDTTQAWRRIAVKFADEVLDVLPEQCVAVAVERVAEATPLPEFAHPESAAYLFGPENGSLDESILERCTHVVCIPGHECLNLAAAVNVVLYDRTAKRWGRVRNAFPPTDGLLRGVRGGYEARRDRDDD